MSSDLGVHRDSSGIVSFTNVRCPNDHPLILEARQCPWKCDQCGAPGEKGVHSLWCQTCDYDECPAHRVLCSSDPSVVPLSGLITVQAQATLCSVVPAAGFCPPLPLQRVEVDSEIAMVTVFKDRAQVFRSARVKLLAGEYSLLFAKGMWSEADRKTLQVSIARGVASTVLRSVQFKSISDVKDVRPEKRAAQEKIRTLEVELAAIEDRLTMIHAKWCAYEQVLRKITGANTNYPGVYDPDSWARVMEFASKGMGQIKVTERLIKTEIEEKREQVAQARKELRALGSDEQRTTRDVAEVLLKAVADVELELLLSYVVRNASWEPVYDIRVDNKDKKVAVTYNAMVKQSTGESWDKVKLELSTANPHVGGDAPTLSTWRISLDPPYLELPRMQRQSEAMSNMFQPQMMMQMMPCSAPGGGGGMPPSPPPPPKPVAAASQAAEVSSSSTATVFKIAGTTTIKSDNQHVKVGIVAATLDCYPRYSAVPKLDSHTYLKVKAVNTTDFVFLAGKTNIFADNQFVSNSSLDLVVPGEEFWTFVGVDDAIKVTRKLVHRKNSEKGGGVFGGVKRTRVEFKYTFTVKNSKKTSEEVVIWDQFPITEDKKIVVSLITPDKEKPVKGQRFETNLVNFIEWFVQAEPGAAPQTFDYVFHVDYPVEERVTGMQ
jgi:uncharacterized protein (TIGR02231 family)